MAEVSCTQTKVLGFNNGLCTKFTWGAFTSANTTAAAISIPGFADKTVQIQGTFDSCTVTLEGSNDGTNYIVLTDPQGNAISKTASAIEAVTENTLWIKPVLATAGASTSVVVTILAKAGVR